MKLISAPPMLHHSSLLPIKPVNYRYCHRYFQHYRAVLFNRGESKRSKPFGETDGFIDRRHPAIIRPTRQKWLNPRIARALPIILPSKMNNAPPEAPTAAAHDFTFRRMADDGGGILLTITGQRDRWPMFDGLPASMPVAR